MSRIVAQRRLVQNIFEMVVQAPRLAAEGRPGQFAIVMGGERAERIPLTIAKEMRQWRNRVVTIQGARTAEDPSGRRTVLRWTPVGSPCVWDQNKSTSSTAGATSDWHSSSSVLFRESHD